jgi:hypothetical protein
MRSLFVVLLAANALMFGLGQGWFGGTGPEPGTEPALMKTQLNANALQIATEPAARNP